MIDIELIEQWQALKNTITTKSEALDLMVIGSELVLRGYALNENSQWIKNDDSGGTTLSLVKLLTSSQITLTLITILN